ncbi:MAG: Arylsulfatase [candidate division BRC1 bacterium ADurb.BinA364]|nr:MAG: Arylsulfatase [candidate division BRC1 bacterium ADurb.BinA364]
MPTCLELAGAAPPETIKGRPVQPLEGRSLAPLFRGEQPAGREAIFWQYGQSRAVRQGDWKLAANGAGPWELYDLSRDRNELDNLAARQPERTAAMAALWDEWAKRVGAKQQAADEKPKAARTAKPAKPGAKE